MQETAKISLESRNIAAKIADDELNTPEPTLRKDLWLELASQLEDDGVEKIDVPTKIIHLVEDRMRAKTADPDERAKVKFYNRWFYITMKSNGYGKGASNLTALVQSDNSSQVNKEMLAAAHKMRDVCDYLISVLKYYKDSDGKPLELAQHLDKDALNIFTIDMRLLSQTIKQTIDKKSKVPPTIQLIFKTIYRTQNSMLSVALAVTKAQIKMLSDRKDFLTKKQARKFLRGEEPAMLEIFKPKSRDEAIFGGWLGIQCSCSSWRIDSEYRCTDCHVIQKAVTINHCPQCHYLFFDEDMIKLKKLGKCPGCRSTVRLPESMR